MVSVLVKAAAPWLRTVSVIVLSQSWKVNGASASTRLGAVFRLAESCGTSALEQPSSQPKESCARFSAEARQAVLLTATVPVR